MPKRRTKRGAERTPLGSDYDVLVCGASFAGLTLARQLAGSGARTLLVDRYEVGERQTSACAAPTEWLQALGLESSMRQTFGQLVVHTPHGTDRMDLPFTFSTFDYPELCAELLAGCDCDFETATVTGRASAAGALPGEAPGAPPSAAGAVGEAATGAPIRIATDRGEVAAPLVADCLGWRRVLDDGYQPPDAPLSRGLEVHPHGGSEELEIWIDRSYVPAGYGWSFPARDEVRVGIGSFDPRFHVKEPTVRLAQDLDRDAVRYQGNWIPHKLRDATGDGIFFVGDSAGHCLPLTAEGIRTAFYFAIAAGTEMREVIAGRATRAEALSRYADFSASHERKYRWMLRTQRLVPRLPPRLLARAIGAISRRRFVEWSFGHYLRIAPPEYAREHARVPTPSPRLRAAA